MPPAIGDHFIALFHEPSLLPVQQHILELSRTGNRADHSLLDMSPMLMSPLFPVTMQCGGDVSWLEVDTLILVPRCPSWDFFFKSSEWRH